MDFIRDEFMKRGDAGLWSAYVRDHLLPRLFGFELLMAPYAMAHLKLGMQLAGYDLPKEQRKHWRYDFEGDERLGVYLTNTLDEAVSDGRCSLAPTASERGGERGRAGEKRSAHNGRAGKSAILRPLR